MVAWDQEGSFRCEQLIVGYNFIQTIRGRLTMFIFLSRSFRFRHRYGGVRKILLRLGACLLFFSFVACQNSSETSTPPTSQEPATSISINLGIGSMITPKEGYVFYKNMGEYLAKQLHRPVVITDRKTYDATNKMLQDSKLDIAFVCGGPYVEGKERFDLQLLVKPETLSGKTVYYSLILVPADSPATSLDDLRGKSFAFVDPKSNTGFIVPSAMLARMGETSEEFFGETIFTYAHDRSIRAVAEKIVDAAAVDSLIFEYLTHTNPQLTSQVRILLRSEPYGIPPVVVRPDLPPELRDQLRNILLEMDKDAEGAKILNGMLLRRFVPAKDSDYDSIRRDRDLVREIEAR